MSWEAWWLICVVVFGASYGLTRAVLFIYGEWRDAPWDPYEQPTHPPYRDPDHPTMKGG